MISSLTWITGDIFEFLAKGGKQWKLLQRRRQEEAFDFWYQFQHKKQLSNLSNLISIVMSSISPSLKNWCRPKKSNNIKFFKIHYE